MERSLSTQQFGLLCAIANTPSPSGFERTVLEEVIMPALGELPALWHVHRFLGNAGIVIDTAPDYETAITIMIDAHVDKIALQVKSTTSGIRVESSMGTATSLMGALVSLVVPDKDNPGSFLMLPGCTLEGLGASHHASADVKAGKAGVPMKQLYIETGAFGEKDGRSKWYKDAGITPGVSVILDSPVQRSAFPGTFRGAYLDNSLGVLALIEFVRWLKEHHPDHSQVRFLLSFSACEEIGKMGAMVAAQHYKPDVLVAIDVGHDTQDAPGLVGTNSTPIAMGKGAILTRGSIHHRGLIAFFTNLARENEVPIQEAHVEKRSGNNSMAGIDVGGDIASLPLGIPLRYMHTPNEMGCDEDLLSAVELLQLFGESALGGRVSRDMLRSSYPRIRTD